MIRELTLTASRKLMVIFRCASCDETNVQQITLKVQQKYEDKAFTQKGQARQWDRNETKLMERMDRIASNLESGAGVITFARAKLKCACKKCNTRQPWAKMNYTWGFMLVGLVLIYIMGMLIGLMNDEASWRHLYNIRTIYLPLGIGAVVLLLLGMGIHFAVMTLKHRSATQDAPVLFARTVSELKKKAAAVENYRDADYREFE